MKIILILIFFTLAACRENIIEVDEETDGSGVIYVSSNPSGATIYWNNWNMLKSTPDSLSHVYPGIHYVTLRRPGYRDSTITVYMQSGNRSQLEIELVPGT